MQALPSVVRIAMLHLAPRLGDLAYNRALLEAAVTQAAAAGAAWILTPELWTCGYLFADVLGTDWITPPPDPWMRRFCREVARLQVTVFLSYPERDGQTGQLYNSVFVITADGRIAGVHRKVRVIPIAEAWASRGPASVPIRLPQVTVGILICADAYTPEIAGHLQRQGAQLLLSSAAWGPGAHGPYDSWEARSRETGLPLFVCNRTGSEAPLSFVDAESVVVKDGRRLFSWRAAYSTLLVIDWDLHGHRLVGYETQRLYAGGEEKVWPRPMDISEKNGTMPP